MTFPDEFVPDNPPILIYGTCPYCGAFWMMRFIEEIDYGNCAFGVVRCYACGEEWEDCR